MNAMFFDLDGTLLDSRADLVATVNHTREELGLKPLAFDAVLANVGQGAKYLLKESIPEYAQDVERLWQVFRGHYAEHMLESCTLYPGVEETLAELSRHGWKLGINTSKPAFATHAILEHFHIDGYFGEGVIAGGDCAEMKPSAMPLEECAKRLHHELTPDDWMVGDSWTDMQCAINAGVKGAFCAFGFGNLKDIAFTARLESFGDLLNVV